METNTHLKTPKDIYESCNVLHDIANRLEDSENSARQYNLAQEAKVKRENKSNDLFPQNKRVQKKYCDTYHITEIMDSRGEWKRFPSTAKENGKAEFERDIVSIINGRDVKALKILLYRGKKVRNTQAYESFNAYLSEEAEIIEEEKNTQISGTELPLNPQMESFIERMEQITKANSDESLKNGFNPVIQQMGFDKELLKIKHEQELNNIKLNHERKIEKLERESLEREKDLKETIQELEYDLSDAQKTILEQDGELGSVADELKKKYTPSMATIGESILKGAITGFVTENPKLISKIAGVPEAELLGILAPPNANEESEKENAQATVDFAEETDEYEGFDENHASLIKGLHATVKGLTLEQFKLVYTIIAYCFDAKTQQFDNEKAQQLYLLTQKNNENGNN